MSNMTPVAYAHPQLIKDVKKNPILLKEELSSQKVDLMHMALGIAGEAGEVVDVIKKYAVYDKPLNREHIIEEMGDLEFYLEGLRQILKINRDEVLEMNIIKLRRRYNDTYSDRAAIDRNDKIDEEKKESIRTVLPLGE